MCGRFLRGPRTIVVVANDFRTEMPLTTQAIVGASNRFYSGLEEYVIGGAAVERHLALRAVVLGENTVFDA